MGGAPGDGVGRVGALLAGAHVGRGSCRAFAVDCAGLAGPQWCRKIRRNLARASSRPGARWVSWAKKRSGNKIDLILGRNERGGAQAAVVS